MKLTHATLMLLFSSAALVLQILGLLQLISGNLLEGLQSIIAADVITYCRKKMKQEVTEEPSS